MLGPVLRTAQKQTMRVKEGKIVGALSGSTCAKGGKSFEAIRHFGSIDKG
jgi:hypothetical protein